MTVTRRNTYLALAAVAASALVAPMWRLRAQSRATDAGTKVQAVDPRAARPRVTNADRGATYHTLERQARRVTTRFVDAVAVAERAADGTMTARVADVSGNEQASLRVTPVDTVSETLNFKIGTESVLNAARRSGLRPTLDWSNQQAYSFFKDSPAPDAPLEWQDAIVRPKGRQVRPADWQALETRTEWQGGLSAVATRRPGPQINAITGKRTASDVIVSHFFRDNVEMGISYWYDADQLFAWSFPGLTEGYADSTRVKAVGGWPIVNDMAWINTQNLAFYEFGTVLKERGKVSENRGGWLHRVASLAIPSLHANDLGCDDLHWLDGTLLRYCCDSHDICYATSGCTSTTWWQWWSSWTCDVCNMSVTWCFSTVGRIYVRFP